ncbi:hypothetical protein Scep_016520 [Stephania cephalantha]|uniref:Uncharacterized protein n=1 Tax=Stephania cephalantha TaxID=152367 RepID=A0AAP0IPQ3_9MAGN
MHYHLVVVLIWRIEVLQSCVIVIIWSPYCSSYSTGHVGVLVIGVLNIRWILFLVIKLNSFCAYL